MTTIVIIDGQGGGIGKLITEKVRKHIGFEHHIIALGTNALAAAGMLKSGANEAASGEAAFINVCKKADIIIGPISIVIPNSMLGEITITMSEMVNQSSAHVLLLPLIKGKYVLVGCKDEPLPHLIDILITELDLLLKQRKGASKLCEANAYLIKDGKEELLLERVDIIIPEADGIFLESIFGEQKKVNATIVKMELVDHKIILEEKK